MINATVSFACLLWIAVSFFIFLRKPFKEAILTSFFCGWMFLPIFSIPISGLPDIDKSSLIVLNIFFLCFLWELRGKVKRPKLLIQKFDIIVITYVFTYLITAQLNGLGVYDGFSRAVSRSIEVAIPYFIGRLYFSSLSSHSLIAKSYLYSVFLYLPLALYEIRFSPQLHSMVYGYAQHSFAQTDRDGVWRPMIFMRHGLEVALWMALAGIIGIWLIRTRIITKGFTIITVGLLCIITILGQSWGSIILLLIAISTLVMCHFFKMGLPFILLFIFPVFYITNRILNLQLERPIIEVSRGILPLRRFRSVTYRVDQEYKLINHDNQRMFFGWGAFGRDRGHCTGREAFS